MINQAILMGIRIVVVNRTTGREWVASLNAEGVLCAMTEETKKSGLNHHNGSTDVMVEGLPMRVDYSVIYSHYDGGMSVTTKVSTKADDPIAPKWLIKLIPLFDIRWPEEYPVAI